MYRLVKITPNIETVNCYTLAGIKTQLKRKMCPECIAHSGPKLIHMLASNCAREFYLQDTTTQMFPKDAVRLFDDTGEDTPHEK